jgi:hypothetical protein
MRVLEPPAIAFICGSAGLQCGNHAPSRLHLRSFCKWEGERSQPEEIRMGMIVVIAGVFLTRIMSMARGMKGWSYR